LNESTSLQIRLAKLCERIGAAITKITILTLHHLRYDTRGKKMLSKTTIIGVLTMGLTLVSPAIYAAPEQCANDPANPHYYEVITADEITWESAKAAASDMFFSPSPGETSLQGHLATITSLPEDECIDALRRDALVSAGLGGTLAKPQVWVGGSQPAGVPAGQLWVWVNGEPAISTFQAPLGTYSNWRMGPPQEPSGDGNHLAVGLFNEFTWNDSVAGAGFIGGYVVEYDGTVPADTCVDDGMGVPESCNPAGVQETTFPEGTVTPPGSTYTQTILEIPDPNNPGNTLGVKLLDPRVDSVTGECSDRRRLDVFDEFPDLGGALGGAPGDLILSRFECGSPEFAVLKSEANGFEILNDVVRSRQLPEEIFGLATFPCDINAVAGDLQTRGVFAWQPDDKTDVLERRALELTNGCGSRRGATKDLSFFILNLHTDCGIPFGSNNGAVLQCFRGLTVGKFATLGVSLLQTRANREISRAQYRQLRRTLARSRNQFIFGNYDTSLLEISMFIAGVQAAGIAPSPRNFEGDLLMRAENIEFTTMKIRDEVSPPIPPIP
jgi:hypothetical protein